MNLLFLYTRLILAVMRPWVNCWIPLTPVSHCVTTSSPESATQTRTREAQPGTLRYLYARCCSCHNSLFWGLGPPQNMLACIPCGLGRFVHSLFVRMYHLITNALHTYVQSLLCQMEAEYTVKYI